MTEGTRTVKERKKEKMKERNRKGRKQKERKKERKKERIIGGKIERKTDPTKKTSVLCQREEKKELRCV